MYLLDTNIIVEFLRGRLPHTYRVFMRSDPRIGSENQPGPGTRQPCRLVHPGPGPGGRGNPVR